ncbi:MAG: hypothetical protein KKA60_10805 [Proteobacteria bacterium]|nr:hypothetical protein [Pseudomonadota bacterium]
MNDITPKNRPAPPEPLAEARNRLMALPAEEAVEAILDHPRAGALVRSLSDQDFRLLVLENGPADSLEIIALASDSQWRHILDMDAWRGDRLLAPLVTKWLGLLAAAAPERVTRWLLNEERDLTRWWFHKNLSIQVLAEDEDPSDLPDGYFSLDGVLHFCVTPRREEDEPEVPGQEPFIQAMLERMAAEDYSIFHGLSFEAGAVLPAEAEEELFRFRGVRLAERGFPPFHEAVGVYRHTTAEAVSKAPAKAPPLANDPLLAPIPPVAPGQALSHESLFSRSLSVVDRAAAAADLQAEFASLANQVGCADRQGVSSREELASVVRKSAGYVSLGLFRLSGDNPAPAADLLLRHRLSDLFALGFSQALELKFDAERWRKNAWFTSRGLALTFFGEQGLGVLGGLFLKRPMYFDNYRTGSLYRDFERPGEILEARTILSRIVAADGILEAMEVPGKSIPRPLTHKSLILTLWARRELGLPGLAPLSMKELARFLSGLWEETGQGKRIRSGAKESFLLGLPGSGESSPAGLPQGAENFLEDLFREMEEELSGVEPTAPDPRFVTLFWMDPAGAH